MNRALAASSRNVSTFANPPHSEHARPMATVEKSATAKAVARKTVLVMGPSLDGRRHFMVVVAGGLGASRFKISWTSSTSLAESFRRSARKVSTFLLPGGQERAYRRTDRRMIG